MDSKHIRELVDLMIEKDVAELQLEQHGVSLRIRRPEMVVAGQPTVVSMAGVGQSPAASGPPAETAPAHPGAHLVRSPMVGTFFTSPEPDAPVFAAVGDHVDAGQTLCIVEAMKLMNEITADVAGQLVAVFPDNGQPVEYGQDLFAIQPD